MHEGHVECHIDRENRQKNDGRCVNDTFSRRDRYQWMYYSLLQGQLHTLALKILLEALERNVCRHPKNHHPQKALSSLSNERFLAKSEQYGFGIDPDNRDRDKECTQDDD